MPKITLAGSDFIEPDEPRLQSNALIFGDSGVGKTTFGLMAAPEPVAILSLDRRGDHAAIRARNEGRTVYFSRIDYPGNIAKLSADEAMKKGREVLQKFFKNFDIAVRESQKGNVRTVLIDTITEFGEICAIAERGTLGKAKGDYGKSKDLINRHHWRIFNTAREGEAHVIALARAKAVWEDNEPTGRFTYRCVDVVNDAVDWAANLRFKRKFSKQAKTNGVMELEITKGGINREEVGKVYTEEDWEGFGGPFVYACMMQYVEAGTTPEDWQ